MIRAGVVRSSLNSQTMKTAAAVGLAYVLLLSGPALAASGHDIVMQGTKSGAPPCSACHGENGAGQPEEGFPRLAGLNAAYMERQLASFDDGTRDNPVMGPVAKALDSAQRKAVADYYAGLSIPAAKAAASPVTDAVKAGAALATRGLWAKGVPGCGQCHGPQGSGVGAVFPRLAGQSAMYIKTQLEAWQSGTRHDDPMGLMAGIAKKLDKAEVDDVAAYYAAMPNLPAAQPVAKPAQHAVATPAGTDAHAFMPPPDSAIPDNEFGKMVRFGAEVFRNTQANAGEFVGNALQCENCHLDNGRKADSAPLWAAFVAYPAYRGKNKHVNTFAERLQGCFRYSMNGTPPPLGDKVLVGLQSYAYFLAKGAPVGADMPGRGYPDLPKPESLDRAHGQEVYAQKCALCHGENGEGQKTADGTTVFPPLWGPDSFNWGAGMGSISNAAKFVKANMPLSQGGTLTDKEAWDVAAFVDSHDRPQDPRFTGSVDETRKQFHDTPMSLYGTEVDGVKLGENSPPSGPQ